MIKCYINLDKELKQQICRDFETHQDFDLLVKKYSTLEYNTIYSLLYTIYNYRQVEKLCQVKVSDKKICIESDFHVDSIFENLSYIDKGTDFAYVNGCKTFLLGGDYIEGRTSHRKEDSCAKQAEKFIKVFPTIPGVMSYGIYGNHDNNAAEEDEETIAILSSRNDMVMLGYRKAFFDWNGVIVCISHDIKDYKISVPPITSYDYLQLKGHSHFYGIAGLKNGDETTHVPAMCDDPVATTSCISTNKKSKRYRNFNVKPGFIISERFDDEVVTTYYSFSYGDIIREDEQVKTLKKTIN